MRTRRIVTETKTIAVNFSSGEIVAEENTNSYRIPQEPPYVKLYLDTIMYLCDLQERHANVLMAVLRFAPFADLEHQYVVINRSIKLLIAKELKKSENFVNHAIMELAKGNILLHNDISPRSSSYQINPHIIARGDWKDIEKLRLHIDFDARGKTFWSEIQIQKKLAKDKKYGEMKRAELAALEEQKEQAEARRKKEYEELKAQIRKEIEEEMKRAE